MSTKYTAQHHVAPLNDLTSSTQAVRTLGGLPGVVKSDLDPLLRLLDTMGDGRVSLPALMDWAGRDVLSAAGVENAVSGRGRFCLAVDQVPGG